MNKLAVHCIDINTPHCPCFLAETNHCVFCSHLRGEPFCDCDWSGVCILYEKQWQSKKKTWRGDDSPVRIEVETEIRIKQQITEKTYLLEMEVTDDLAKELTKTGAFVFLRRPQDPMFYHFPVAAMKVSGTTLEVGIEMIGPKSTRILADNNRKILVRGPYYNGIFGQPWIDKITSGKILLLAGGMGQPPALPIACNLSSNNNIITAILAPGKVGKVFIENDLYNLGVKVYTVKSMRNDGMLKVMEWFESPDQCPDLVVSAGPDELHYSVISAMQSAGINIPMAATNNATMCCGEGICGSCEKITNDQQVIRTCKVQTDFSKFIMSTAMKL